MLEVFELELLGGSTLERYRAMRPEVEEMPWGTFDASEFPPELVVAARRAWTGAAFQEFRTGAACAATLQALIEARAPVDLIALAARFPLDEMVHVELCARLAAEMGGAVELVYEAEGIIPKLGGDCSPLMRAAHLVVAFFCVGEALSIPLLHGTSKAADHPLVKKVLHRIVVDEADHGTFGWSFLDWASPMLTQEDLAALGHTADRFIASVRESWRNLRTQQSSSMDDAHALGWLGTDDYLKLAERSMERQVLRPLRARAIPLSSADLPGDVFMAPGIAPPAGPPA